MTEENFPGSKNVNVLADNINNNNMTGVRKFPSVLSMRAISKAQFDPGM
jgi:hypothetical protein